MIFNIFGGTRYTITFLDEHGGIAVDKDGVETMPILSKLISSQVAIKAFAL